MLILISVLKGVVLSLGLFLFSLLSATKSLANSNRKPYWQTFMSTLKNTVSRDFFRTREGIHTAVILAFIAVAGAISFSTITQQNEEERNLRKMCNVETHSVVKLNGKLVCADKRALDEFHTLQDLIKSKTTEISQVQK